MPSKPALHRLVPSPVFILSSIRSGSTLLRCILDTHSKIRAPHELHLADLEVQLTSPYIEMAMQASNLEKGEIEHLLWDRMLHRELAVTGKDIVVDKTPGNLLLWRRLAACWPQARYIFLLRHPLHILESSLAGRPEQDPAQTQQLVTRYLRELDAARRTLNGATVRYEDLTRDAKQVSREICAYLDMPWEPEMLNYGTADHGPFVQGIGDFTDNIKSGVVQPGRSLPADADVPESLMEACRAFGYMEAHR
ncbi:sulfotransferase family protein [Streptomyces albiflavescens]|uniref:Sulfotransferase family protein n=1 Tax=Streptomyces albiflavescens TaxID=1623582 RepID=A0A918D3M8_9ACTN|nr:sulfotransferase [Streptomyces albiflavescens]GGN62015.1 sulfotransferase family protein [Streptomyces albiflavescens]